MKELEIKSYAYNQLTPEILFTCDSISGICNEYDNMKSPYFIDDETLTKPILFCGYMESTMAGFLSVYEIDLQNIEICGFVLPEYRKKSIFTKLLKELHRDYSQYRLHTSLPKSSTIAKSAVQSLGFHYCSTECKMVLSRENYLPKESYFILFQESENETDIYYLSDTDIDFGYCLVNVQKKSAILHDVEIYEEFRHKGYGYELLCLVLNHLFERCDHVILHVTKENIPAYKLYTKLGFLCIEEMEYYVSD